MLSTDINNLEGVLFKASSALAGFRL